MMLNFCFYGIIFFVEILNRKLLREKKCCLIFSVLLILVFGVFDGWF